MKYTIGEGVFFSKLYTFTSILRPWFLVWEIKIIKELSRRVNCSPQRSLIDCSVFYVVSAIKPYNDGEN